MEELTNIYKELEKLKKKVNELEDDKAMLESELLIYNTERKAKLMENMNEFEKEFIACLEDMQDDYCYDDCELSRYKLCEYEIMLEHFFESLKQIIDEKKIKQYFEFEKWHK